MDREDIRLSIRNIKTLPTLPVIVTRVLEVTDSANASANELGDVIANDVSLSAKVLNLANSAFYGFTRRITTIRQAVVVLGFDTVRSLALSVSVFDALKGSNGHVSFDREAFWMHSVGCGTAARLVGKLVGCRDTGTLFVAGLLHDLGKVILDTYFHDLYQEVVEDMVAEGRPATEVERDLLDIDHAEVGGWLAERWSFPAVLVAPIAHHHDPMSSGAEHLRETLIVHLSNILVKRHGIGLCYETVPQRLSREVASELQLNRERVTSLRESLDKEREHITEFLGQLSA